MSESQNQEMSQENREIFSKMLEGLSRAIKFSGRLEIATKLYERNHREEACQIAKEVMAEMTRLIESGNRAAMGLVHPLVELETFYTKAGDADQAINCLLLKDKVFSIQL